VYIQGRGYERESEKDWPKFVQMRKEIGDMENSIYESYWSVKCGIFLE
jgi:hypothetical protein